MPRVLKSRILLIIMGTLLFFLVPKFVLALDNYQPLVKVYKGSNLQVNFFAYDKNFKGGVNVALGDINGDGLEEIITGAGEGGGPHVRIFNGYGELISQFFAYHPNFRGGVRVAAGDVNGDGIDEIITGAGPGGGPHVRVFRSDGKFLMDFWPFHPKFSGGVDVAAGDVDGDGIDEIAMSQLSAGQAWIKVYKFNSQRTILGEWNAFGKFEGGGKVALGDINGEGKAEVIIGAGLGGGPQVRIFNGQGRWTGKHFFAYDLNFKGGVYVATGDIDGDGKDEIITGAGKGGEPHLRAFEANGKPRALSIFPYLKEFRGGVDVACGSIYKEKKQACVVAPQTLRKVLVGPIFSEIINLKDGQLDGVNYVILGKASPQTKYVQVSTDGGKSWYKARAIGQDYTFWSYYWSWSKGGTYTILSRAVGYDGFIQPNPKAITVKVLLPKILTMVQEIIVDDYQIKPILEANLDDFLSHISKHFNALELKIWCGQWSDETIRMAQKVIDQAHAHGLRVALSVWGYPNDNERAPQNYYGQKLDSNTGQPSSVITYTPYDQPGLDKGNPQAVRFMADRFKEALERLKDIDYIFFNEDKLQTWSEPWPELTTNYWDSPTYSLADLNSFRDFLVKNYGSEYRNRKFPVQEAKFVNSRTELNKNSIYWNWWYLWRKEIFASWLNKMAKSAYQANKDSPNFQGAFYMQWQRVVLNGNKYGVSLEAIGQLAPYIDIFVCEHGEDIDLQLNEEGAKFVSSKAKKYEKEYGGFVNLYRWATGEHSTRELVKSEFDLAIKYGAKYIVAFNGETFYPKSKYYHQGLVDLWDWLVRKYIK